MHRGHRLRESTTLFLFLQSSHTLQVEGVKTARFVRWKVLFVWLESNTALFADVDNNDTARLALAGTVLLFREGDMNLGHGALWRA